MKTIALRSLLVTIICFGGIVSYGLAGSHGGGHGRSHQATSGPGFSSDDNPGFLGRMGKDEHNDFFTKDNNPGVQGSAFGRSTAAQAGDSHQQTTSLLENAASSSRRPDPVPSATPSRGISPIPSATPGSGGIDPIPSATPGGHSGVSDASTMLSSHAVSPIPSATPGGSHPPSPLPVPSPIPSATIPAHPPAGFGISPIPSATPSRGINPVPSATPGQK